MLRTLVLWIRGRWWREPGAPDEPGPPPACEPPEHDPHLDIPRPPCKAALLEEMREHAAWVAEHHQGAPPQLEDKP